MKQAVKIVVIFLLILTVIIIVFKYGIKITTYDKSGFTVTTDTYTDEDFKKALEYYKVKDFENLKKFDYEYTKFFEFPKKGAICEYIYFNRTTIYEGPARERNIYAVLCDDKTIKYVRGDIGTVESIEERYKYDEPRKDSWIHYDSEDEYELELTNVQYDNIISLLKLLKLFHTRDKEYNLWEPANEDRNVFYLEGEYYNFEKDDKFISSIIENALEKYLREILYEDSGFDWDNSPDME